MKHIGALASPGVTYCGVPAAYSVVRSETQWRPQGRLALAWGSPLLATSSCPAPSHLSFPADTHAYPVSISFHKPTLYLGRSSALLGASLFCSNASFLSFPISLPNPHLPALCHWFPLSGPTATWSSSLHPEGQTGFLVEPLPHVGFLLGLSHQPLGWPGPKELKLLPNRGITSLGSKEAVFRRDALRPHCCTGSRGNGFLRIQCSGRCSYCASQIRPEIARAN